MPPATLTAFCRHQVEQAVCEEEDDKVDNRLYVIRVALLVRVVKCSI